MGHRDMKRLFEGQIKIHIMGKVVLYILFGSNKIMFSFSLVVIENKIE